MAQEAGLQAGAGAQSDSGRDLPPMLVGFVKYMEEAGLMHLYKEGDDRDAEVESDVRIQALVLLASRFGLGSPYACDMYLLGPGSRALAGDAYSLSRDRAGAYDAAPAAVPDSFRKEEFERLVSGRDTDWLVAASTLAGMRAYRSTRELLIDAVRDDDLDGKPKYPKEYVACVIDELEGAGLVTAHA